MTYPALRVVRADNTSPMTLDGTRTFLVGRARPVVIDPGPDDAGHLERIVAALADAPPAAILLTHDHPDHAAGAPALARRTGAPVLGLDGGRASVALDGRIGEGERVETDAGVLAVLATPGHTPDGVCFYWTGGEAPAGGALFVGDMLMGEGDTTLVAPPEGDLTAYLTSLARLEREGASVLYPAHGPALVHPAGAFARYRTHRMERINRVRDALDDGVPADPEALVDRIYGATLDPRLRGAAAGSLRAVLEHLTRLGDEAR